jgi:O-antigen ligase
MKPLTIIIEAGLALLILTIIIEAGLALLILFTPFAFASAPLWAYTSMELLVLVIVFAWVLRMAREGELSFPKTPLNISILLFLALVIFQIIPLPESLLNIISPATGRFYYDTLSASGSGELSGVATVRLAGTISLHPYTTKVELLKVISYLGCFFLVIGNLNSRGQLRRLLVLIMITGFLLALFAIIQHFTWNGKIYWIYDYVKGGTPFGPFVNKNNFAGYINMIIPLTLIVTLHERNNSLKAIFAFMALVMTIAVFLSMSRGGVLSFFGSMIFLVTMLFSLRREYSRRLLFIFPAIFFFALIIYLVFIGINPVVERLATLSEKATYSGEIRWTVWASTIDIIKDYPFFGTGLETFESVFPGYRSLEASILHWRDAHNDYLQLIAETGIVGFLIALSFFVIFFARAFRTVFSTETMVFGRILPGLLASVVAFLISNIFTFNSHIPAVALLFSIICAIVVKITMSDKRAGIIEES